MNPVHPGGIIEIISYLMGRRTLSIAVVSFQVGHESSNSKISFGIYVENTISQKNVFMVAVTTKLSASKSTSHNAKNVACTIPSQSAPIVKLVLKTTQDSQTLHSTVHFAPTCLFADSG
uniref:Uncharacterized protein n=1 Tax=Caenorhabditis japonica TaxID=281687 RepID=A0A8R1ELP3_CAEJA